MKRIFFTLLFVAINSYSQVKIGDNPEIIDSQSILELESSNKVLVVTRISSSEMNALTPLNGALIYNTDENCLFQFNNNAWNSLCTNVMDNETVTSLIDNNDGTISYSAEDGSVTIINKAALTDNGDGTLTFDNGNGSPLNIDISALETVTTLIDNADGTFTYESENGTTTTIDTNSTETITSIVLNPDDTNIDYTDENGNVSQLDLSTVIANLETLTTLIDNNDGTFSYTAEDGNSTILDVSNLETLTAIAIAPDNTNIDYTDENGNVTQLDLSAIVSNLETLTLLTDNNDGTLTYTDENGNTTQINVANLETLTTLVDNGDLTFTYINEDGVPVTISVIDNDNDSTNELQDLFLNGTELTLSNPETAGNVVDLTGQITLPMFANGTNTNDEIYWNGTQWVYGTRVATVNLSHPDADGNVNIPVGNVYTGPTTDVDDISSIEIGGVPHEGDIYVVNSDASDPTQVGATYIYDADTMTWIAVDPFNTNLYDPRYVNVTGDTMVGNLDMSGNTVTGLGNPIGPTDATPKSYVDNISLVDNGDGSFSLNKPDGSIDTVNKATLTANPNGTFTFDNNDGAPVTIDVSNLETLTSIALNNDNENIDYMDENGNTIQLNLTNIIANLEALTSLVDNNDGTFTYTDEDGNITTLDISNAETLTSIALNTDDINIDYIDEGGNTTQLNLTNIVKNLETLTSLTDNNDGTITYTDESGNNTVLNINNIETLTSIVDNGDSTITYSDEDGNDTTFSIADNDNDPTNEIQTIVSADGSVTITPNGNDYDLSITTPINNDNDPTNEIQTLAQSGTNVTLSNGGGTISVADNDDDPTNEIQTVESSDGSVTVTPNGNDFDLSITIPANNDNDPTNELNTSVVLNGTDLETTDAGGTITTDLSSLDESAEVTTVQNNLDTHIANDLDIDPTNEIQTVESSDGSVTVTPNGNDFDLSIIIPSNNDNDPTNEIQDISTDTTAGNISLSNGSTLTLNVDDPDSDSTNELQTISQIGNDVTLSNGGGTISVSDNDNDSSNEIQTVESTDGSINVTQNGNDYDLSITIPTNNDNDPTNEIQDISTDASAGNISLSGGSTLTLNVDDADASPLNEIQKVESTNGSVNITQNGNDYDLSVTIPLNNDNDSTNEIQDISTDATAGNISLSNGSSLTLNVNDADADPTNEIQTLSQSGNDITLSNGGGTISVSDNDNDATNEIQTIASVDGSVIVTPSGNNYDLSITTPTNNDNDPTNEITTVTDNLDGTSTILDVNGGTVTVDNDGVDNVDDADNDITNELQNIALNGTELSLSTPATAGNLVDLTGQITLPMFADGSNTNDEIYWDGTQWVYGTRVATVNLVAPDPDGNVNIPIGNVYTGPTTITGDIGPIEVGGSPQEGDIYVVNSSASDPSQVGATYIYDSDTMTWIAIDPFNAALYDPRYVNVTGDTMVGNLIMSGNTVTGLASPINATDAASKSYVDSMSLIDNGNGTFTLNKPDGTLDTINKANLTDNGDGTYTFDNNDGSPVTISVSALETVTSITDNGNLTITYLNESGNPTTFSVADNDNDPANEIQSITSTDGTVTVSPTGNDYDLSIAIPTNNDNDATNEIQTLSQTGNDVILSNGGGMISVADNDNDSANEIQVITSTDNSVGITQNGNDYDLSIAIPANNDNDPTNEIQDISTDATAGNISLSSGSTLTLNVNDADADSSNEIQTVESTDGTVNVTANGNDYDLSIVIPANNDNDPTNEIQDISTDATAGNISLSSGSTLTLNVNDADSDITNEIQTVESTDGTVTVTQNGNDFDLSVSAETVTTLTQNTSTGVISYSNETPAIQTANVVSTDADNDISVGTDGGAYYASPVKAMGKVNANGTTNKAPFNATVTRLSIGRYQVVLTPAMPDPNYIIQLTIRDSNGAGNDDYDVSYTSQTTNGFVVEVGDNDNGGSDRALRDFEFMFTVLNY